jgi:hypothetical protein
MPGRRHVLEGLGVPRMSDIVKGIESLGRAIEQLGLWPDEEIDRVAPPLPPPVIRPALVPSVGGAGGRHFAGWHHRFGARSLCPGCADTLTKELPDHHGWSSSPMKPAETYSCGRCGRHVTARG